MDLTLPDESPEEESTESVKDESTEHGDMLKKALDSGDGAAICEAVRRIVG